MFLYLFSITPEARGLREMTHRGLKDFIMIYLEKFQDFNQRSISIVFPFERFPGALQACLRVEIPAPERD